MSGFFDGFSALLIQSRPVVSVCAQVWSFFRSAIECGTGACLESRTPWFAFRYDVVKSTVRLRCCVIVASWNETSNFLVPGAKRPVHGEYIQTGVTPSFAAIAFARSTS